MIAAPWDYRDAARRRLPPFLFNYLDGGAGTESALDRNMHDLARIELPQRVLRGVANADTAIDLLGRQWSMPVALAPVGLTGMYARRGEVAAARAAATAGLPYTLSTVSVCSIAEVAQASPAPIWFQLYVLRDRGFMRDALERASAAGVETLVFTVDMPVPGRRYRDPRSGMSGPNGPWRRMLQALTHPRWAIDVGVRGRPHDLGNISAYLGAPTRLADYIAWLGANFDPGITWQDLSWIRDAWHGRIVVKGILEPQDAREAIAFGADGIIVSNHGGRQLDGAMSTVHALPAIVAAVDGSIPVIVDSGIRSGLDVVRMLALGADATLIGRAYVYALATQGQRGVEDVLRAFDADIRTTMALVGAERIRDLRALQTIPVAQ